MDWLISIAIGALIGWAAGKIMKSNHGLLTNILLGWVGSVLGNYIAGLLKISSESLAGNILFAIGGACLILAIFG